MCDYLQGPVKLSDTTIIYYSKLQALTN